MNRLLLLLFFVLCNCYSQNSKTFKIIKRNGTYGKFTIYQFDYEGKIKRIKDGFRMTKKTNDTLIYHDISFLYKNDLLIEIIYKTKERVDLRAYNEGLNQTYRDNYKYTFEYHPNNKIKSYNYTFKRNYSQLKNNNFSKKPEVTKLEYDKKWNLSLIKKENHNVFFTYDDSNRITEILGKEKPFIPTKEIDIAYIPADPEEYLSKELYFYTKDTIKKETYEYSFNSKTSILKSRLEFSYGKDNALIEKKYTYNPENLFYELSEGSRFSYSENGIINEIFYPNSNTPIKLLFESKTNINLPINIIKKINEIILNDGISIFGYKKSIIPEF